MTYLDAPIGRVICDTCGWTMSADDENDVAHMLLVHLDFWAEELRRFGTEHTRTNRDAWLKERA